MNPSNPENSNELLAKLSALLAQTTTPLQVAPFGGPAAMPAAMSAPQGFGQPVQPVGLLVPISLPTQAGDVGCYVQLPAAALANPQAAIAALQAQCWPVRAYGGGNGNTAGNGWQQRGGRAWGRRW